MNSLRALILGLILTSVLSLPALAQPRHLYLTWENEDTATTQTVVFHTDGKADTPRVELKDSEGKVSTHSAQTVMITGTQRRVHRATLTGLQSNTVYTFRAGDGRHGLSPWRTFRTLPADDTPLTIAVGGDMFWHPATVTLAQIASRQRPHLALLGGDIAYADGKLENLPFWDRWFDNWDQHMNRSGEPMVPIISAIGNHEVRGYFGQPRQNAPFYFAFLPQGGNPYFQRRLGSALRVTILDTNHVTPHAAQVPFLKKSLEQSTAEKVPYHLVSYHVPNYPTQGVFNGPQAVEGRKHWVPLFDQHRVTAALEHHDHVFKRSHPLKNNKIDPEGTVYLGDGAWGMPARKIPEVRWYHAQASSTQHFWLLETGPNGLRCRAFNLQGEVFDETTLKPRFENR